jgi:hypothetical protein
MKINLTTTENEATKLSEIKRSIEEIKGEIRQMERKQGILEWQLRTSIINQHKI